MAFEYTVRDPFPMPNGNMRARGDKLSDADVVELSNEDHEHKLQRHCVRSYVEDVAPPTPPKRQQQATTE